MAGLLTRSPLSGLPILADSGKGLLIKVKRSLQQRVLLPVYTAFPFISLVKKPLENHSAAKVNCFYRNQNYFRGVQFFSFF
jgi:hypothetical protein